VEGDSSEQIVQMFNELQDPKLLSSLHHSNNPSHHNPSHHNNPSYHTAQSATQTQQPHRKVGKRRKYFSFVHHCHLVIVSLPSIDVVIVVIIITIIIIIIIIMVIVVVIIGGSVVVISIIIIIIIINRTVAHVDVVVVMFAASAPEAPSQLHIERVEGNSLVLAWQPPVLDHMGCSNGSKVVGYRVRTLVH
jgi:hypothetical protein